MAVRVQSVGLMYADQALLDMVVPLEGLLPFLPVFSLTPLNPALPLESDHESHHRSQP